MFEKYSALIIIMLLLIYTAKTDGEKEEIPLYACVSALMAILVIRVATGFSAADFLPYILAAGLMFLIMLVNAALFGGGGGDCILMFVIGFAFGIISSLMILSASCIMLAVYYLLSRGGTAKSSYPMAPAILISTMIISFI
ncbi:MAG: hypothetical protein GXY05_16330 [Clostridiales bacterium]|nr:hypothetical protein [Clostridiales bacterium]